MALGKTIGDREFSKFVEDETGKIAVRTHNQFGTAALVSLTTSVVKSSAGFLHAVNIGGVSGPTISLWDNTVPSGTLIHRFHADAPVATYLFDVKFTTGLSIKAVGGGINPQVQISYK